jgi:hypothetical protein
MAPFVTMILSLVVLWLAYTGRIEEVWEALKKGKK